MGKPIRVLLVEDSKTDAELILHELQIGGYEPFFERVDTAEEMRQALAGQKWDIIIADYVMPRFSGLAALDLFKTWGIDLPFIVVSGKIGEDVAVEAMKAGAHDYLLKGNLVRLAAAVERELREAEGRRERRRAEDERDRLLEQLKRVNERLTITSLRMQEQAEESGRLAAELDAMFTAGAEAIVIYSPAGEVVRLNPVAMTLLGLEQDDPETPAAKKGADRQAEIGRSLLQPGGPVAQALLGETVRAVLTAIHRPDGRVVWVSISAAPILTAEEELLGAVATFTDVTSLQEEQSSSISQS